MSGGQTEVGTVSGEDKDCLEGMIARFSKKKKKKKHRIQEIRILKKLLIVYLKLKFNCTSCTLSGDSIASFEVSLYPFSNGSSLFQPERVGHFLGRP